MNKKKQISLVILDLDNTVWDWITIWYKSFSSMINKASQISKIEKEILFRETKTIFESKGTSEYSFVLTEMPSLLKKYGNADSILTNLKPAIWAHRNARHKYSKLYPKVLSTLRTLKEKGCIIAAYTESMKFYTNRRLISLGLDGIIDYIYYGKNHPLPKGFQRIYPDDKYELVSTKSVEIKSNIKKPSPQILNKIVNDLNINKRNVLYVGDNLYKDVKMAKEAGIIDVWAKYGSRVNNKKPYKLLRKVTHWSNDDVEKERKIYESDSIKASYVLKNSIKELMKYFHFIKPEKKNVNNKKIKIEYCLEAWKKVIDVQMHFNEIEMKIRNLVLTIFTAIISATFIVLKTDIHIPAWSIPFAGILGLFAFFIMDFFWYHRLLYGAVKQGLYIEDNLKNILPEISLTTKIKEESPFRINNIKIGSKEKLIIFYSLIGLILIILTIICYLLNDSNSRIESDEKKQDSITIIKKN